MRKFIYLLPLFAAAVIAQMTYTGVNLSGGEFGKFYWQYRLKVTLLAYSC